MTDKSKFDRKTPSAGFFNFLYMWMLWSTLIGVITIASLGALLQRNASLNPSQIVDTLLQGMKVLIGTGCVYVVCRWQGQTLHKKTGRDLKHWGIWSAASWFIGVLIAHGISHRLMIESNNDTLATVGILGLGLAIIYLMHGIGQSIRLAKHIDLAWIYGFILIVGVVFWALFVGDPRRIALGGLLAPALQGFVSGIVLMWLFHLSKLGNIALKAKNEQPAA